jgi:hypothetical protein
MSVFYSELLGPLEALSLAQDMAKWLPANKTWAQRVAHQQAMVHAEALIAEPKFTEALTLIEETQRPSGSHGTTWVLMKAKAGAGAGQLDQVYTMLVDSVAALPDDRLQAGPHEVRSGPEENGGGNRRGCLADSTGKGDSRDAVSAHE